VVRREFNLSSCSSEDVGDNESDVGSSSTGYEGSDDDVESAEETQDASSFEDNGVRVLGSFKTRKDARVAIEGFANTRYKRFNNNRDTVRYACSSHAECTATAKFKYNTSSTMYTATLLGFHNKFIAPIADQRTGIHKPLDDEVNNLLLGGHGPAKCLTTLEMKYRHDEETLRMLPDVRQLKNRSQLLRTQVDFDITSMADIMQWAAPRMCKTKSDFLKGMTFDALTDSIVFAEKPFNYRNELLVLDIFTEQLGKDNESIGIIFTSRKLFRNVALAIMGQLEGVMVMTTNLTLATGR